MTITEMAEVFDDCADVIQEYRNGPLDLSPRRYKELLALEVNARAAARQLLRRLDPLPAPPSLKGERESDEHGNS